MATITIQENGVTVETATVSQEVYEMISKGRRNPEHEEIYKREVQFNDNGGFVLKTQ